MNNRKELSMAELKTKKTNASVKAFIDGVEDAQQRKDSRTIAKKLVTQSVREMAKKG